MVSVALTTCAAWPGLSAGDAPYARALVHRHGADVLVARWNAPEDESLFAGADVTVLRSNWDYHHEPEAFLAWLERFRSTGRLLFNPPAIVSWNLDKGYLLELAACGVRVPRTIVADNEPQAIRAAVQAVGCEPVVIKPAMGASGHEVYKATRANLETVIARIMAGARGRRILAQEFLPEISEGEQSFVFIDGEFAHLVERRPDRTRRLDYDGGEAEFRANSQYGVVVQLVQQPDPRCVERARAILDALPELPLYARVDGVFRGGRLILTELELNEPSLWLQLNPEAAARFADATLRRLQRS